MADSLRWAVMGTGTIAAKVWPRIEAADRCRVVCGASRQIERARVFAAEMDLPPTAACTYEGLLDRDDVDVVYVTLPNHLHGAWCTRLLEAGKHVLCEKPLTASRAEAEAIFDAAERAGRLAVEGFMYMHHPQTTRLVEIARGALGRHALSAAVSTSAPQRHVTDIGPLVRIEGRFDVNLVDLPHAWTRFLHSMWGGALMDLGCYPVGLSRLVTGAEPRVLDARAQWAEVPEGEPGPVDLSCEIELLYEIEGRRIPCHIHCSMGERSARRVLFRIEGQWGAVHTPYPFGADPERAALTLERNDRHPDGPGHTRIIIENGGDRFENQFADFAAVVRGERDPLPSPAWSIAQAAVLEEILARIGLSFDPPKGA